MSVLAKGWGGGTPDHSLIHISTSDNMSYSPYDEGPPPPKRSWWGAFICFWRGHAWVRRRFYLGLPQAVRICVRCNKELYL